MNITADRIVSLIEVAAISGLGLNTIKRCRDRGEIKIIKLSPRRVGVRLSDLQAWLDSRNAA